MDRETGQRLAEMIATAVVTKLTDKAIDELLEYLKQKEKTPQNKVYVLPEYTPPLILENVY